MFEIRATNARQFGVARERGTDETEVSLHLCGQPAVLTNGEVRPISGVRNQQIVTVLGLRIGQATQQDLISDVLFPNSAAAPPSSIRTYVARCRKAISPIGIENAGGYCLQLDEDRVDSAAFARRVAAADALWKSGRHEEAASEYASAHRLWTGTPFVSLPDWMQAIIERERLEELRAHAVERSLMWRLASENPASIVAELTAAQRAEPLREIRTALLMRALAMTMRPAEASRVFAEFRNELVEETGLEPSPELSSLDQAILLDIALPPLPLVRTSAVAHQPKRSPIKPAGRERELAQLEALLARSGHAPRLIQLHAAAGMGKTSLIDWATKDTSLVFRTGCSYGERHGSLRPARMLVRSINECSDRAADSEPHQALKWILEPGSGSAPAMDEVPEGRLLDIFDAIATLLHDVGGPPLLIFDDIHWADDHTRQLIPHLARHGPAGMRILVAARPDEVAVPLELHGVDAHELDLAQLTTADLSDVLRVHGVDTADLDLQSVLGRAGGNPFFALELARSATGGGAIPASISATLQPRLDAVGVAGRSVVEVLWAAGGPLAHEALVACVDAEAETFLQSVDTVTRLGIATQEAGDGTVSYDIAHDLMRDVVRDRIPPIRRFDLHHRLALAIEPLLAQERAPWIDRAATQWHQAGRLGDPERAEGLSFEAGMRAYQACAFAAAEAHLQRCEDARRWTGKPARPDVSLWRARCAHRLGDAEGRRRYADEAFERAVSQGDVATTAHAALVHGGDRSTYGVNNLMTTQLLERALEEEDLSEPFRAEIEARLAQERHHALDFNSSASLSRAAMSRVVPPEARLQALAGRIWVLNHPEFLDQRVALIEEMRDVAEAIGSWEFLLQANIWMASAVLEVGDVAMVDTLLSESRALLERVRVQPLAVRVQTLAACRTFMTGDLAGALDAAQDAYALGLVGEPENADQVLQAQMIGPLRELGQLPSVLPMISEMADTFDLAPGWQCALAFVLSEAGDTERAREILLPHAASRFTTVPRDLAWFRAMAYAAEAVSTIGMSEAVDPLLELLAPYTGRNVGLWDIESGGASDHYVGLLHAHRGAHDAAVLSFTVAEEFNDLTNQPHRALRSSLHKARSLNQLGDPAATTTIGRVAERASSLGFLQLEALASEPW